MKTVMGVVESSSITADVGVADAGAYNVISLDDARASRKRPLAVAASIYPALEKDDLRVANDLLNEAIARLSASEEGAHVGNLFVADNEAMHFMTLLPELFCLKICDSFSMIVSSTYHALHNMRGGPLSDAQRHVLRSAFELLKKEPYLDEQVALNLIEEMERVELDHNMPELEYMAELLLGPLDASEDDKVDAATA